jgi:glycosyltransferase involved in cell wall biosynthesis
MGDGVAKAGLVASVISSKANVRFLDYKPVNVAKSAIQQADVGLVSLIPELYKFSYPSKTMAYMEQGKPIIASIESKSELAKEMLSKNYGFPVPIGDPNAIAELFIRLADDVSWKKIMNETSLNYFKKNFSSKVVLDRWARVVEFGSIEHGAFD